MVHWHPKVEAPVNTVVDTLPVENMKDGLIQETVSSFGTCAFTQTIPFLEYVITSGTNWPEAHSVNTVAAEAFVHHISELSETRTATTPCVGPVYTAISLTAYFGALFVIHAPTLPAHIGNQSLSLIAHVPIVADCISMEDISL